MLRTFLFIAAITCAVDSAPAQELDGRLKQIYQTGTIKLAYRSDANPFSFVPNIKGFYASDFQILSNNTKDFGVTYSRHFPWPPLNA